MIKILTPYDTYHSFNERMGHGYIRNTFDFHDLKDSQIGLPTVKAEEGIVVATDVARWIRSGNGTVEHSADGNASYIASVNTEANYLPAILIHDNENPMRF